MLARRPIAYAAATAAAAAAAAAAVHAVKHWIASSIEGQ